MRQATHERAEAAGLLLQALAVLGRGEFADDDPGLTQAADDLARAGFVALERAPDRLVITLLLEDRL